MSSSHLVQRLAALPHPVTESLGVDQVASNLTEVGLCLCLQEKRARPPPAPSAAACRWCYRR